MSAARDQMKIERVTITFRPRGDARGTMRVPSTYDAVQRAYGWRNAGGIEYMIVPTRVSGQEVEVDLFVNVRGIPRSRAQGLSRLVRAFVEERTETEWKGLEVHSIGRPTAAVPPSARMVRGSIEDILGIGFDR
jgi:hypothetical protein